MINLREIILGALMDIVEEEQYSHIVLKDVLEKYQYLDKRDRAFITRVTEGTLENMLQMVISLSSFSKVKVENMKPVIRQHPAYVGLSVKIYGQCTGFCRL